MTCASGSSSPALKCAVVLVDSVLFRSMNICLIGAPGVGKGTFSKLLVKKLGLIHISIGDIIRKEVENKSAAGIRVRNYVEDGLLIPDGIVNDIVLQKLQKYTFSNILLDGFPRNVKQAEFVKCSYA